MGEDNRNLSNNSGTPIDDDQNTLTAGDRGPMLLQDIHLVEKLAHFDRERIFAQPGPLYRDVMNDEAT